MPQKLRVTGPFSNVCSASPVERHLIGREADEGRDRRAGRPPAIAAMAIADVIAARPTPRTAPRRSGSRRCAGFAGHARPRPLSEHLDQPEPLADQLHVRREAAIARRNRPRAPRRQSAVAIRSPSPSSRAKAASTSSKRADRRPRRSRSPRARRPCPSSTTSRRPTSGIRLAAPRIVAQRAAGRRLAAATAPAPAARRPARGLSPKREASRHRHSGSATAAHELSPPNSVGMSSGRKP